MMFPVEREPSVVFVEAEEALVPVPVALAKVAQKVRSVLSSQERVVTIIVVASL